MLIYAVLFMDWKQIRRFDGSQPFDAVCALLSCYKVQRLIIHRLERGSGACLMAFGRKIKYGGRMRKRLLRQGATHLELERWFSYCS